MNKLICFFRTREHYRNRLTKRGGKHWMFLLARKTGKKMVADKRTRTNCYVYRFRNYLWLTQDYRLQTFINKDI